MAYKSYAGYFASPTFVKRVLNRASTSQLVGRVPRAQRDMFTLT